MKINVKYGCNSLEKSYKEYSKTDGASKHVHMKETFDYCEKGNCKAKWEETVCLPIKGKRIIVYVWWMPTMNYNGTACSEVSDLYTPRFGEVQQIMGITDHYAGDK